MRYVRQGHETAAGCADDSQSSQRREAIGERFEVAVPEAYQERYNLAPQQRTLIVRERDDERETGEAAARTDNKLLPIATNLG